jgi:hypothetical protein
MTVSIAEALVGDPWYCGQRLGAGLAAPSVHPSEHVKENEPALTNYVAGIGPQLSSTVPFYVIPHPGDLTQVPATVSLPAGTVSTSWKYSQSVAGTIYRQLARKHRFLLKKGRT